VASGRRFRIHDNALRELRDAARRYEKERRGLGVDLVLAVNKATQKIVEAPERWPVTSGARRYVLPDLPFSIYYRVSEREILVVAVAHQRRRPGYWVHRR